MNPEAFHIETRYPQIAWQEMRDMRCLLKVKGVPEKAHMISVNQLQTWIVQGESEAQEFKQTTGQRTDACKTLCAFLNHRGGRVIFGITPDHKLAGQQVSDKTLQSLVTEIQNIEPPVFPNIEQVSVNDGRGAIVVSINQGGRQPYTYKNRPYKRVGSSTLEMSRDEYNRILLEQMHATTRWENEVTEGWKVQDLDTEEIVRTLEEAIRRGRSEDPGTRDPTDILRGLGLLSRDGQLLRAAVVLFARRKHLLPDYPQCRLRLARFRGSDKTDFLDNRQFTDNTFQLLRLAERFLIENLPVAGRIVPNLFERIDDPLYPPLALREALANALCHRDYAIGGGSVGVAIYDDRLEITSSGGLHFGLTVEDLYKPHESLPWNPLIANVFYKRGIIEAWGRGTLKIVELVKRAGLPKPDIEAVSGAVTIRFLPTRYIPPQRVGHNLTPRQQAILEVLAKQQRASSGEIRLAVDPKADPRRLRDDLALLRQLGLVGLEGFGRGARWFLLPTE